MRHSQAAALAGERDEVVLAARGAMDAAEAAGQDPTVEERAELAFDEARERPRVVLADAVQERAERVAVSAESWIAAAARSRGCRRGPGRGRSARESCAAACRAGVRPRGSGGTESAHGDGSRRWRACAGGGSPAGEGSSRGGGSRCKCQRRSVLGRGGGTAQSPSATVG